MDNSFVMGMLNGLANRNKEIQAILQRQAVLVAVLRERNPLYILHHEVRSSLFRHSTIEHLGDVWMIHQSQCLTFGFKTGQHLF